MYRVWSFTGVGICVFLGFIKQMFKMFLAYQFIFSGQGLGSRGGPKENEKQA